MSSLLPFRSLLLALLACVGCSEASLGQSQLAALDAPAERPWAGYRKSLRSAFEASLNPVLMPGDVKLEEVARLMSEILPEDALVTNGAGNFMTFLHRYFVYKGFPSQVGPVSGYMGYALPAAIAAKLARPDLPAVCLLGDGCFQMTCGEVATAKRLGITLPIVVLDDRWLALIKVKQMRRQLPLYGTELQAEAYREPPAHYFGVPAVAADSAAALETAVRTALAANGPTVIEAVVDSDHYADTVYD